MNDQIEERLQRCFAAVFPGPTIGQVPDVRTRSLAGLDSMTIETLIAVISEEFGEEMDLDDLDELESFQGILTYLRGRVNV